MSQKLTLSDSLYQWLQAEAQKRGLGSIEQLLEAWRAQHDDLRRRQAAVREIDALREALSTRYGEMRDSTELIREDRER